MPRPSNTSNPITTALPQPTRSVIYAISDSTGNLARHMLAAFLPQFPPGALSIRVEQFVRSDDHLQQVLARAAEESAIICQAVVSPGLKKTIVGFCTKKKMPALDLTGPAMDFLARHIGIPAHADLNALDRKSVV